MSFLKRRHEEEGKEEEESMNNDTSSDLSQNTGEAKSSTNKGEQAQAEARDADFSKPEQDKTPVPASQEEELKKIRTELDEYKDKFLRLLAEFENYKKRALKERSELIKYQGERIFLDLLSIVDNLDRALIHVQADPEKLKQGISLIHKMFIDLLSKWEVRSESGLGQEFDPARYEAISKIALDDAKPGTIVNELRRAYFYKDKLLRPGEVVVATEKPVSEEKNGHLKDSEGENTEEDH